MKSADAQAHDLIFLKTQLRLHQIVLSLIVANLPIKRDWLDPAVERNAKQLLKNYKP